MRPIWSGGISFGLIYIPVKLYSGVESESINFDLLREKDMEPIGYAKIVKSTGESVEREEITRGFEYAKGKYVKISDEELEEANPKRHKTIDVIGFIDPKDVSHKYFEKPYLLEPEKKSEKTYVLFVESLKNTKKAALTKFVLRNREHLALIEADEKMLTLTQLRYHDELKDTSELDLPSSVVIEKEEIEMAQELIKKLTKDFNPKKYHDTYKDEVMEMIEEKVSKKKISKRSEEPSATKMTDLMKQLKKSLSMSEK